MSDRPLFEELTHLHENVISRLHDKRPKHQFVIKKLRMLPDFFYITPFRNNFNSTIIAARVSISSLFLLFGLISLYRRNIKPHDENQKKYKFNFFSKKYLAYEKELLLFEKYSKNKYIF